MRSASIPSGASIRRAAGSLTAAENTFRNAKLGRPALVVYKAAADVGAKAALFVITVVAARRLSPESFGVFALGTTIGWLISVLTDFGVQLHVARAVARDPEEAPRLLRQWGRVRIGATLAAIAVLGLSLVAIRPGMRWTAPLLLFTLAYGTTSLVEFLNYFYRGLSRSDLESTLTIWQRAATLAGGLIVLVWWPDVTALALAMLVPAVATLIWSARLATSAHPVVPAAPALPRLREVLDVVPIGAGIVLSALYFRIDVLLVEWWAGTEAVGRYNAVFRLIEALRLFPAAVLAVILPDLCRAETYAPLLKVVAGVTAFGLAAAAVLWLSADSLVPALFGGTYRTAVPAFRVLALTLPLLSMNHALTHQLVAWDRQRAYAALCGAALIFNVALNTWLIPWLSIEGAAWATFGTELVLTSGCVVALRGR